MSNAELLLMYSIVGMTLALLAIHAAEAKKTTLPFQALVPIMALWPIIIIILTTIKLREIRKKQQ